MTIEGSNIAATAKRIGHEAFIMLKPDLMTSAEKIENETRFAQCAVFTRWRVMV